METKEPKNQVNEAAEQAAAQKKAQMIKAVKYASIVVGAIVAVVLVYIYAVRNPAIEGGNEAIGQADFALMEANGDSAKMAEVLKKYEAVAQNHGQAAGNRANLMAAIGLYEKGDYQKCLEYLDAYSSTGAIIDAAAYSLKGDCYVNLKKYDEAISAFGKAISTSDENPQLTPYFMAKQARVYNETKEYAKELEIYESIKNDYPKYSGMDIDKFIERAKALVEKK